MRINLAITWLIIEALLLTLALTNPVNIPRSIAYSLDDSIIIMIIISIANGNYKAGVGLAGIIIIQLIIGVILSVNPLAIILKPIKWLISGIIQLLPAN